MCIRDRPQADQYLQWLQPLWAADRAGMTAGAVPNFGHPGELVQQIFIVSVIDIKNIPECTVLKIDAQKPVSYTHLDVYKRQHKGGI